ncbi:hypothetical protein AAG570_011571 [Ranatra chinensis]|uniref:Uncharacterized protein n=1 Tax=Ranatra chinensis TaxID=642074 RepID=A0ABD0YL12_9HEMI
MDTLEDVVPTANTPAANTSVMLDSVKNEIMTTMEAIKGFLLFDGSTVDLEEFSYLLVTSNAQLASVSQMLGEVCWRNLYNVLIRRVSPGIRADVGITFKTYIKEVVNKLKERYAGRGVQSQGLRPNSSGCGGRPAKHLSTLLTAWMLS